MIVAGAMIGGGGDDRGRIASPDDRPVVVGQVIDRVGHLFRGAGLESEPRAPVRGPALLSCR